MLLWPSLNSDAHGHCDSLPIRLIQRLLCLLNQDVLIWMSWNISGSKMLDLFHGTLSLSVCSLLICLLLPFSPYIRSKPTGGRLLYRSHGNCPQKAHSVWWRRRKPSITFRRAASRMSVGGFSVAKCVLVFEGPQSDSEQNGHCPPSAQVGHIHSPQGPSTDGLIQEEVTCGGGGNWAQSWHGGAEPSACHNCSISDPCSGSPVLPPQMDSLQKGVSHAWAASQWH